MRFNPPPNWPSPPDGWEPPPGWSPDASWPPLPEGWELFVADDSVAFSAEVVNRPQSVGDESEYFGSERAWSDVSAEATKSAPETPVTTAPVEVSPGQLTVQHLGRAAMIRWADDRRYEIGTIVGVSADVAGISLHLIGSGSVPFLREQSPGGPENPRLFVWL